MVLCTVVVADVVVADVVVVDVVVDVVVVVAKVQSTVNTSNIRGHSNNM